MKKAIVITDSPRVYKDFIRKNGLNSNEYSWVKNTKQLRGYHNIIGIVLFSEMPVIDWDFGMYCESHNIDLVHF